MPGDRLIVKTKLLGWKRGIGNASGSAFVDGNLTWYRFQHRYASYIIRIQDERC